MKIILASASPRRRELLEQAGIPFEILIGSTPVSYTHLTLPTTMLV